MSSLVIQCHVIVVNIVKTRADSALFGTSLINHKYTRCLNAAAANRGLMSGLLQASAVAIHYLFESTCSTLAIRLCN